MRSFRNVVDGEVQFSVAPSAPCPCGSGGPASRCCLTTAGFRKEPASTTCPLPRTGRSLQSCYASVLADCSSKRSREHYISESLLRLLNQNNALRVSGLAWLEDNEKILPPGALASTILCDRHNAVLSPLDAIAVRLFQAFDEDGAGASGKRILCLFSGHDLERWLLKIMCGVAYSKGFKLETEADLSLPKYWLEILFGDADFPDEVMAEYAEAG